MLFRFVLLLVGACLGIGKVQFVGMNIAGFEFGCQIDGNCPLSSIQPPLGIGPDQMQHFAKDDQMNIFRLPVSWQFLVDNILGAKLDSNNLGKYDQLIQACLSTGAYCAIDIHNFARFNGGIIGQGGPTNEQFADLWSQLATEYKANEKMVFGLMNEPHDLDLATWANSVQAAVTAIRNAGATSQIILLPGTNFTSAGRFVSSGSGDYLIQVKNPDGTVDGLILDLHKYLDVDNSGEHAECTTDNINSAFAIVAAFLRKNQRKGLISETGAGNKASSCFADFCAQNTFLNQNADVFLGYIAWAAGSFDTDYILGLTPSKENGVFVDNAMASKCVVSPWLNAGTAVVTSPVASIALSTSTTTTSKTINSPSNAAETVSGGTAGTSTYGGSTTNPRPHESPGPSNSNGVAQTVSTSGVSTADSASVTVAATTMSNRTNLNGSQASISTLTQSSAGANTRRHTFVLLATGLAMVAVMS